MSLTLSIMSPSPTPLWPPRLAVDLFDSCHCPPETGLSRSRTIEPAAGVSCPFNDLVFSLFLWGDPFFLVRSPPLRVAELTSFTETPSHTPPFHQLLSSPFFPNFSSRRDFLTLTVPQLQFACSLFFLSQQVGLPTDSGGKLPFVSLSLLSLLLSS